MEKEEILDILENNKYRIEKGNWEGVYQYIDKYKRAEFAEFLSENGIDIQTMFKKYIPDFAFYFSYIVNIKLADTVTEIRDFAFANCESLQTVTIPISVKKIAECAFQDDDLTIIYEGSQDDWNKIDIDDFAFYQCTYKLNCLK